MEKILKNENLKQILKENSDMEYAKFVVPLLNCKTQVIGVRTPVIKKLAKDFLKNDIDLSCIPYHQNVETDLLLGQYYMKKLSSPILKFEFLDKFLKGADNWAVVDQTSCAFKMNDFATSLPFIKKCLASEYEFVRRFGYLHILTNYKKEEQALRFFKENVKEDTYYVMMSEAWLLAEFFLTFKEEVKEMLLNEKMPLFVVNKTISKICDSYRVSIDEKLEIKKYRRKKGAS